MPVTPYDALIREKAESHGVDPWLVKAFVRVESNFNPRARRGEAAIGDSSFGLMQILYATARSEGYQGTPEGLFDPATNLEYGVRYLKSCLTRTGSEMAAASMYNGGYRPSLGFGAFAPTDGGLVCLARDAQGKCIRSVTLRKGHFSNEQYVSDILKWYAQYKDEAARARLAPTDAVAKVGDTTVAFRPAPWVTLLGLAAAGYAIYKALTGKGPQ